MVDYLKRHAALNMRDISQMCSSMLKRHAELVDWLAEHVGGPEVQNIHKKPRPFTEGASCKYFFRPVIMVAHAIILIVPFVLY